jgi:hypothetical protein
MDFSDARGALAGASSRRRVAEASYTRAGGQAFGKPIETVMKVW